jgi:TatD DNase family protein
MDLLADSHCHLLDERYENLRDEIIKGLSKSGLAFVVEVSASTTESAECLKLATAHKNIFCTIGVHPQNVHEYTEEYEAWAIKQKGNPKIVAFGEIGLDYHRAYMPNDETVQKNAFARQISLADKMALPLVIHTREAFEDTMEILIANKKHIKNGILFHCFSQDENAVKTVREHFDAYFAFGGVVTYKNNKISAGAIRAVPADRLVLETDAPYLTPEPHRGEINRPENVKLVAEYISKLLGIEYSVLARTTLENTKRFYGV